MYRWDLTTNTLSASGHAVAGHWRSVYADGHWSGWNGLRDQLGDPECRRQTASRDPDADADRDPDAHADEDADHYSDRYAHRNAEQYSDADAHVDANSDYHPNEYADAHADRHPNSNRNPAAA